MAKFKFRLATLQRLRESTRDERRAALAEAYHAQQLLTERMQEKQEELAALRATYSEAAAPGRIEVEQLMNAQRFELMVRGEMKVMEDQARLLEKEIERRRLALVEADRQVRVLEKLRDKQLERHQYEQLCREMKQLDEIASRGPSQEVC